MQDLITFLSSIFLPIYQFLNSYPCVLITSIIALSVKTFFLTITLIQGLRSKKTSFPWFCLILVLIGGILASVAWIVSCTYSLFFLNADMRPRLFIIRIAWAFAIIFYQALACFLESISSSDYRIDIRQKIFIALSSSLALGFIYIACFNFNIIKPRPMLEAWLFWCTYRYIFLVITPSIIITLYRLRSAQLPKILHKQLKIMVWAYICPYVLFDFIQIYPLAFFQEYIASNLAVVTISTLLLSYGFYYAARRLIGLRFLNFQSHVHSPRHFNFIEDFKDILGQLSHATSTQELGHITQLFFKNSMYIPPSRTKLYIRNLQQDSQIDDFEITSLPIIVENFVSKHDAGTCEIARFIQKNKIILYDELTFTLFHENIPMYRELVNFLNEINADIFIPIYEKNRIIAYIIVERDARIDQFYSDLERDEMMILTSYLGNVLHLQQNGNIHTFLQREKELKEELYRKHQEIHQYKESIRSFLRDTEQRKIGLLFYKNRRFVFGNKAAQELIDINPHQQEGHPLTQTLKALARQVETYRSPQSCFTKDSKGNKLVLSALPNLEQSNIIITVYYPELSDIIKQQIDMLQDPSQWDYLLYLETTKSGQLINQLIPSSSEQLLNFKIDLLKLALSKKALLLEMAEDDLIPTVEILHHISLRETLQILTLKASEKEHDIAIKLFGINPIFEKQTQQPLLEKLHNTGTLFIQNIHFLDLETQNYLAELIKYGFYHIFKSDKKASCNVRIICSTNQNLQTLVQENKFSRTLFHELKQATLSMPSLLTLSTEELDTLVQGFTEQAAGTQPFKNLLQLTERDRHKLIDSRPASLQEFKRKIQHVLIHKSKKNNILQETQFDPAYHLNDPALIEAARLGKTALKDPKLLALLLQKFEHNQNKIATLLGVNRSSINRRCKEYNLLH